METLELFYLTAKAVFYVFFSLVLIFSIIEIFRITFNKIKKEYQRYKYNNYRKQRSDFIKYMVKYPKYMHPIFYNKYKSRLNKEIKIKDNVIVQDYNDPNVHDKLKNQIKINKHK